MVGDEHRSIHYKKKALPERFWRPLLDAQRDRMYRHFESLFPPAQDLKIVNVGANGSFERREHHFLESRYPFPQNIVACGLEEPDRFRECFPQTRYVQVEREQPLPFEDDEFDLVFSNAVIEHVGDRAQQRMFLSELLRVGRSAFVTTPNRWYPVEFHTLIPLLHYLPPKLYRRIYRRLGFDFFSQEDNLNLLDRESLLDLLPDTVRADVVLHRYLGMPANLFLIVRAP